MNTLTASLSRITAATCAIAITAGSAWAFVNLIERDSSQFASLMATNAEVRFAQVRTHAANTCRNASEPSDQRVSSSVCLKG